MSLEIHLGASGRADATPRMVLLLEDDGYYWFLHPWLERMRDQSGKYLDLYDDVVFTSDDFPRLRKLLDEASLAARDQPAKWEVYVGMQVKPTTQKLYKPVQRDRLIALLDTFRAMVDRAEESGQQLVCTGD